MKLIVSGGWFGRSGLIEFEIRKLFFPKDLSDLEEFEGFVLISYDLTSDLMGVKVKRTTLPPIVCLRLGKKRIVTWDPDPISLYLKGVSLGEKKFKEGIRKVKEYIERGDVYQINLTSRFEFELDGSPKDLFLKFFRRQRVPYAFFLDIGDLWVVSGSMELFLEKKGKVIRSKPIKGTGRRSEEILLSEKERAENLMITDMMRNDIGRVARTGSVRVTELFKVESYETLCQMLSTVEGETDMELPKIISETFPPASVTGAPKRRAVQIIDELEPHPRGYYCGIGGFVKRNGEFTLSVLIRTAYGRGSDLSYFAGCGIVWDSDPERELKELYLKVKAFYPWGG